MKKEFLENTVPEQFEFLEKILQQNKGGGGHFVGNKVCSCIHRRVDYDCNDCKILHTL